jgi:hypothetical protein
MKERILITVKTYPTISREYSELVCTAGLRTDGSWIRIYPVPFRSLSEFEKYKKYQWVDMQVFQNKSDQRPESFRPALDSIELQEVVGTDDEWRERRNLVLDKGVVYSDLAEIIELNRQGKLSLATFKPTKILDFVWEETEKEWDADKIEELEIKSQQQDLFGDSREYLKIVKKLPYKFFYEFEDCRGTRSRLMIEDWEIGALFWNCMESHEGNEVEALRDVHNKYYTQYAMNKDVYLFLGTTLKWDRRGRNPFLIIGVFAPPFKTQGLLF